MFMISPAFQFNDQAGDAYSLVFKNASRLETANSDWLVSRHGLVMGFAQGQLQASSAVIDLDERKGWLAGPVRGVFTLLNQKKRSQTSKAPSTLSNLNSAASGGKGLTGAKVTEPSSAKKQGPIKPLSEDKPDVINKPLADYKAQQDAARSEAKTQLSSVKVESSAISTDQADYEKKSEAIKQSVHESSEGEAPEFSAASLKNAESLEINADGFYFDRVKNVTVYTGNVEVKHPRYILKAKKQLQIHFTKNKKGRDEIKLMVAEGDAFLERTMADGKLQRAKAERIQYDAVLNEIYLINGFPALEKEGEGVLQARKENVWIRLYGNGSLITSPDGDWKIVYSNLKP